MFTSIKKPKLLSPDAEARNNLGAVYSAQGRLHDAALQFEEALRIDPDDLEARENLKRVQSALRE